MDVMKNILETEEINMDDNNIIKLDMSLVNESGTTVFTVKDAKLSDENDDPIT